MTTLPNATVVITGAGHGIGAALARRFATSGARVVVNDLDAAAAQTVADDLDGIAIAGDAVHPDALIARARAHLGEIDLYCANAGIPAGGDEHADDGEWERAWEVNTMAHIRAARLLTPAWRQRGYGHLLCTVSAAGLLTMLGAAPYSVTKHAALAFAEWMAITYRDQGVKVQALCPLGVSTDMIDDIGAYGEVLLRPDAIAPEDVADAVVDALDTDAFLILPHPQVAKMYSRRGSDPDRWQATMRAALAQVEAHEEQSG